MNKVSQKELEKLSEEEGFDLETFETEMSDYDEPQDNEFDRSEFAAQIDQSIAKLHQEAKYDPSARQIFEKIPTGNIFITEDPSDEYDTLRAAGYSEEQISARFIEKTPIREIPSAFFS